MPRDYKFPKAFSVILLLYTSFSGMSFQTPNNTKWFIPSVSRDWNHTSSIFLTSMALLWNLTILSTGEKKKKNTWRICSTSELSKDCFLSLAVTSDETWYEQETKRGPLQQLWHYLPPSHISHPPQEALVAFPNTWSHHQQGVHFPWCLEINGIVPIKHSEGDWEINNSHSTSKSQLNQCWRSTTTLSSPQM